MSQETLYCICKKLGPQLQMEPAHMKLPLSVPQKAAVGPYWLASPVPLTVWVDLGLGVPSMTSGLPSVLPFGTSRKGGLT